MIHGLPTCAISDDLQRLSRSCAYGKGQCDFCVYSYAEVDKISTNIPRRAVPLRYLSLLALSIIILALLSNASNYAC